MTKKIRNSKAKLKLHLSQHPKGALALVGLWKDVPDAEIEKFVDDVYEARDNDKGKKSSDSDRVM